MRIIVLSGLAFLFFVNNSFAQSPAAITGQAGLTGKVIDSLTKRPIEYATVSLLNTSTGKIVTGTIADTQGAFELTGVDAGNYTLLVEFIGYRPFSRKKIEVRRNSLIDLKVILLSTADHVMQGVTVTSKQNLIETKIDKLVFNAEKDLTAQGGVATDLLKKIPMVSVDIDGNVELSGSNAIRFLINGKPSTAFGANINEVLQSLPASQIKSIEVITNPGAKYDAQGLGGIINIILKQNSARGINGNIALTGGSLNENGSLNLNARNGNFGMNAFVSGNYRLRAKTPSSSERLSTDSANDNYTKLDQQGEYRIQRHGTEAGMGFDWTYKKNNSFTGSVGFNDFGNKGTGVTNQSLTQTNGSGTIVSQANSLNNLRNSFDFKSTDLSLNFKRSFAQEDREFEMGIDGSFGNNHITAANRQFFLPQDLLYYGIDSRNPGTSNDIEIHADYTQPLAKSKILGTGVKVSSSDITSNTGIYRFQQDPNHFGYDSSLNNSLHYRQKIYAAYAELSLPVKQLFDLKAGLRYEHTEIDAVYSNVAASVAIPAYNTFVPSIFLSHKLSENDQLRLSYSERIERPEYFDLNPFVNTSDPKNINKGNPYLKPETGNRIELSFNHNFKSAGSLMVSAFYRQNRNDIQPYVIFYPEFQVGDSVYTNVSVSTRQNIGIENNMGINIFADVHPTTKLTLRTNVFFFYRHTINKVETGLTVNSFNYRLNANATYQFSSIFSGEFFGNFNSARNEVQGKYPSFTSYSFALRRQFWKKKGSLALTATNPFNKYVNQRTILKGTNFQVNSLRKVPVRSIGLNFSWKFGKLEFKKEKEERHEGGDGQQ